MLDFDSADEELSAFFDYMWGDGNPVDPARPAYVYLPIEQDKKWVKLMFRWPDKKRGVIRRVLESTATGANVFFSPALFKAANPIKENVLGSWFFWADFDGNAPLDWNNLDEKVSIPHPSLIVQSSIERHEHCYWKLNEFITDSSVIDERNRSIAYSLKADTSGWDADQVLRPPRTQNYKRDVPVTIKEWDR